MRPLLDYSIYSQMEKEGTTFRFIGDLESITDRKTLWIQSKNLTIPVSLTDAQTYLLPIHTGENTPNNVDPGEEVPEQINWNRITTLTEGAKVYIGGPLVFKDDRWIFVSTKEEPLTVIFFDGPDKSLTTRAISAGRHRNEYWNNLTPYSLAMGALCLILIAVAYLHRPAFRLTVITSIIAVFIPLFPFVPPGILFTTFYRRLFWRSRKFMAYSDLARLPLRYFTAHTLNDESEVQLSRLPNGEYYAMVRFEKDIKIVSDEKIPLIIPEIGISANKPYYVFGVLHEDKTIPVEPEDSFAAYGILPDRPDILSKRYARNAFIMETIAWLLLLMGIGVNLFFIRLFLTLF